MKLKDYIINLNFFFRDNYDQISSIKFCWDSESNLNIFVQLLGNDELIFDEHDFIEHPVEYNNLSLYLLNLLTNDDINNTKLEFIVPLDKLLIKSKTRVCEISWI